MSDLIGFFTSFDKLMKEKLVKAFYWLALILIIMLFAARVFHATWLLGPFGYILEFVGFFVATLLAIVGLRLACEMAIALFRINDNLSPDGGASETLDMDPFEEVRRAAEGAARKTREATGKVVNRTKSAADDLDDKMDDLEETIEDRMEDIAEKVKDSASEAKETVKKTASRAKTAAKSTAKKATSAAKETAPKLKKDGTPRKKPGPKPKPKADT